MTIAKQHSASSGPDLKGIGRRIREIRGFDRRQIELAKALGTTQAQLSKYERGENAPSLDILLKLKLLSGKTIDWNDCG